MTTHSDKDLREAKNLAKRLAICFMPPLDNFETTESYKDAIEIIITALAVTHAEARKSTYDEIISAFEGIRMHGKIPRGMITVSSAIGTVKILKEESERPA